MMQEHYVKALKAHQVVLWDVLPKGMYRPFVRSGNTVYLSGVLACDAHGQVFRGRFNTLDDVGEAAFALRALKSSMFSALYAACDRDWNRLAQVIKLEVWMQADGDFEGHSQVGNEISKALVDVLQERGAHARVALGMASLPLGSMLEVALTIQLTEEVRKDEKV